MSWLTGWTYRRAIIIAPSVDGAQTDYQLKLLVGESAGAAGCQVHCAGQILSSYDDLRFTTADGQTLCPYWIESITGATPNQLATVWIKIPSIAASPANTTVYMYYGNAAASAAGSGADTFIKFEDFEWGADGDPLSDDGGSVDWSVAVAGTSKADIDTAQKYGGSRSGRLYRDGTGAPDAYFTHTAGSDYAIRLRLRKDTAASFFLRHGNGTNRILLRYYNDELIYYYNGGYISTEASLAAATWGLLEINNINFADGLYDIWLDGVRILDSAGMHMASSTQDDVISFYSNLGTGSEVWFDDLIVRKWTASEPAWSSFGTEELSPSSYHVILSAAYSEESPELNRAFVVGSDAAGGQVSGSAVTQAEVDLVGERMDAHHDPAIPTAAVASAVAAAMLAKCRLDGRRAEIVIPPHCGLELWDVLAVIDTVANQDTLYRVTGYQLEYDTVKGDYFHRIQLCAV